MLVVIVFGAFSETDYACVIHDRATEWNPTGSPAWGHTEEW